MAFLLTNFSRQTVAMNAGLDTGPTPDQGASQIFTFMSTTDAAATVEAANYFAPASYSLYVNDFIFCVCSDATVLLQVLTVDNSTVPAGVTTETVGFAQAVGTANIIDGAVTAGKLASDSVTTVKILDANVTSAKLEAGLVHYKRVSIALADFIASHTTPVELLAAPGAGFTYMIHRATLGINYGGTVLAVGGTVQLTYGAASGDAASICTGTQAAATLIGATADTTLGFTPVNTTLTEAKTENKAVSLSTETADFTGGTASTYVVDVWYSTIVVD